MLKYQNIFQIKYKEVISSNSTVIVRYYQNADAVLKDNFNVLFIIIFGTLSFPIKYSVQFWRFTHSVSFSLIDYLQSIICFG